jgi:hypothetical protein
MTEQEWLDCADPMMMVDFLGGKMSNRKMQLLACACCRRIWHLLIDERSRGAVEALERVADGLAAPSSLNSTRALAEAAVEFTSWAAHASSQAHLATVAVRWALTAGGTTSALGNAVNAAACDKDPRYGREYSATKKAEGKWQAVLLRDIIRPFGSLTFDSVLLTPILRAMAQTAYEERQLPAGSLDRASIAAVADTLEETGCTEQAILEHLRGPGPHVRGCWAVDLLTGRR